jgi:oxygen-independent coproporphyrinogen-3 oxidase
MITCSIYIHIPFCIHRCGYCDFTTYAGLQPLIPSYTQALCREVEFLSREAAIRLPVHTIYFGGGTPSLLPIHGLEEIISSLEKHFTILPGVEITLEANPGTVTKEYLKDLFSIGVNRLSLGMQSANADELKLLERQHTFVDVIQAVEWSRLAGFQNLNLDLIFGLPYQKLDVWMVSMEKALSLRPNHLSLYALTLEHGTPMQTKVENGILPEQDPDLAADMYERASECLNDSGFTQYEISNWGGKNSDGEPFMCQHNLQYWHNLPYLGVGAGAHGFVDHYRTVNVPTPGAYIVALNSESGNSSGGHTFPRTPATIEMHPIDRETEIGETMMMGLRLIQEGVSEQVFYARFVESLYQRFSVQIDRLISLGLLEWDGKQGDILRLTKKGRLLGNQVFKEFI